MKRKRLPAFWFCEVYRVNYWFFIGWPVEDFKAFMKKRFNYQPKEDSTTCDGKTFVCTHNDSTIICIWTQQNAGKKFMGTLAHECVHAAINTLHPRGINTCDQNDEPLAYLVGALIRKALGG